MRFIRVLCLSVVTLILPGSPSSAQIVGVSVRVAPPPIPVYVQPPIPSPGYLWVPGYWAWEEDDYFWVPGTWVLPPTVGYLWTPGYWYWGDGSYLWRAGYWGPRVGFYGGVNYGCGYYGTGFVGGHWRGRVFAYNRAVTNIGTTRITNVYVDKTVIIKKTTSNVSFNGGTGGTDARPNVEEQASEHGKRTPPTYMQRTHQRAASTNRALFAKVNDGKPATATTTKAGRFSERGVFAAKDARGALRPDTLNSPSNNSRSVQGAGDASKAAGPKEHTINSKGGALGSSNRHRVTKDQQTSRVDPGKGVGPRGPYGPGGANGYPRVTPMRGGAHPVQGQVRKSPPETKRSPNYQGKRPDQG
jgi:hypothetical protein